MPVQVVTPQNIVELITTGKVERPADQAPTRREKLALKANGAKPAAEPKPAVKAEPKSEPSVKEEPKGGTNSSEKVDDKTKVEVKPSPADATSAELDENGLTAAQRAEYTERVRKAIGAKHREAREATEFAEFQRKARITAEKRVAELEAELAKAKPAAKSEESTKAKGDKPKPEDFASVAEFTDALTDWKLDQREAQRTQKQAEERETERQSKASDTWQTRLAAAMEENPEFDDTVRKAFGPNEKPVAKAVISYIEESEYGPALLLRLATHPDEMATFRSLAAEKAIGFLGRLEAKLETPPTPKQEPASKEEPAPKVEEKKPEPAPVNKVSKAPSPADTSVLSAEPFRKNPADMTTEEYLAHRKAQRRAQRRAQSGR